MTTRYRAGPVAAFEEALGDDAQWARRAAGTDAAERFPAEGCAQLDAFGLPRYYVPSQWGGALDDHEVLLRLWRAVARRDLSTVIAHGKTYLGAAPVWVAGDARQAADTARSVLSGGAVAWALSEPEHGADLLRGSLTAVAEDGGYVLDGVKWPVNNATRADLLTVLARTGAAGSGRGLSLFLVEKSALPAGSRRALPKARTHGVRGIDISGIELTAARVPAGALLGAQGAGAEIVLRSLQLTRTMCAALSLGAGEQALRLAARFAAERVIQRRVLIDRPYPASVVARCAGLLAAIEAAALVSARGVHSLTAELSVSSTLVKALAPTLADAMIAELVELLGVRSYLTEEYGHGAFQRVWRDHQVVSVFDGSTPVNRGTLVQQFPRLVRGLEQGRVDADGLAHAVAVGEPPPPLDYAALTLTSRTGCSLVQSLGALDATPETAGHIEALRAAAERVNRLMAAVRPAPRPAMAAYEAAEAYELCYAAACCLHLWASGRDRHADEPLWRDGLWLRAALRALRARLAAVLREPEPASAPGDEAAGLRLAWLIADAARSGAPVTPFGAQTAGY